MRAVLGKPGTWQNLGHGARYPRDGSLHFCSGAQAESLSPHSPSRVECFWCVSQTLNCPLSRFPTIGSLFFLYLLWKRPSSYVSPWQVFGNRPAHQEEAPEFQWVRAGPCQGEVLLGPHRTHHSAEGQGQKWLVGEGSTYCCCCLEESSLFRNSFESPKQQYLQKPKNIIEGKIFYFSTLVQNVDLKILTEYLYKGYINN